MGEYLQTSVMVVLEIVMTHNGRNRVCNLAWTLATTTTTLVLNNRKQVSDIKIMYVK